jgi:outer membrane protein assembly factor BamB
LGKDSIYQTDTSREKSPSADKILDEAPKDINGAAVFRGDLRRTGVYATEGMQNPAGLKWKAQVGRVWDPIVLYNGLILFFRENDYLLTAIDISNGREKWKVPNSCRGNLAVAEGLAYYRSGQPLYCMDIKSQEIKWRQDKWTNEDIVVSDGILVTRTANDDLCAFDARTGRELWDFVIGQRQFHLRVYNGLVYTHSHDGAIHGVDMKSGREKSRLKLEKPEYLTGLFEISRGVMFCKVFLDEPPYGDDQGEVKSGKYFLLAFDLEKGKRKWKIPCEGFFFEPALSDDTIIIESGDRLWAFDINTGQQRWSVKVPGVNYQPTIFEGAVYIACDDGCLYAHDLRNGAEKWSFEIGKRIHRDRTPFLVGEKGVVYFSTPFEGIYSLDTHAAERGYTEHNLFETAGAIVSTPAIIDGTAFFGSMDGHIYAVNVLSKKEIWRFKTTGSVVSSPLIANQTLYCGSDDQHLYSLDTKTGQEKWRFKTTGPVVSSPAISDEMILFGSRDKHLYALDPKDGTLKWRFKTSGQVDSSPAVADGIVCFGSHDGYMYAVDFRTGRKKWRFKASAAITSSPAIMDKRVFFGDLAGNFYAVELKTGKKVWNFAANSPIPSSAAVKDNMVYFGAEDGTFFVLDATNGQQKDSQKFRGAINSSPSIVGDDGAIYFGCDDGSLYGLDRQLKKKLEIRTSGPVRASPAIANGAVYFGSSDGALRIIR